MSSVSMSVQTCSACVYFAVFTQAVWKSLIFLIKIASPTAVTGFALADCQLKYKFVKIPEHNRATSKFYQTKLSINGD